MFALAQNNSSPSSPTTSQLTTTPLNFGRLVAKISSGVLCSVVDNILIANSQLFYSAASNQSKPQTQQISLVCLSNYLGELNYLDLLKLQATNNHVVKICKDIFSPHARSPSDIISHVGCVVGKKHITNYCGADRKCIWASLD
jgi:hypothetical protein